MSTEGQQLSERLREAGQPLSERSREAGQPLSERLREAGQPLTLTAADGYPLAATWFACPGAQRVVLVAGATAVPQGFYRRFATAMNARGYHALTLDYRGIGRSKHGSLSAMNTRYEDWGRLDLAAALDYAAQHGAVVLAGHSFGGHALGMLPSPERIHAAWFCGSGAGWSGYMPLLERVKVELIWRVISPLAVRLKGYAPMSWFGAGEDLPPGVWQDWRRWCGMPRYCFDDPELQGSDFLARYRQVRTPMQFLNADDDLWALPTSRDAFVDAAYSAAQPARQTLSPHHFGVSTIGHMGYFRPALATLWQQAGDFFDTQLSNT
jgi:predicted alpha/beta hydrolase